MQIFNNNVLNNDIGACIIANTLSIPVMVSNNQFGSSTEQDYGIVFDTINGISSNNMVSNALVGIMATTSASVNTLVTSSGDQFPGVNENYQAVSQFAYSPYYATIGPIINVTMTVKNDEDTGLVGYWALDNYTKHVTVWQTDANTYAANVTYLGMWHTFNGALSPQNGIIEPDNGTGTLQGSYTATFNTPTFNSMANTIGNLGTFDFGGTVNDILLGTYSSNQIGNQNPFDWVGYYFPGYTNFVQPTWSWTYTNNTYHFYGNQWVNSYAGNSGDIITGPTIKVTYNVRNDSDSRYSGYWALDNYTQTLTVWHIGADQYAVNAIDVGVSCTFAGAPSPNAGIPQVANGCAVMTGGYDGNLTTSNTPVNTTQTTLGTGTLNSGGKISGILNNAPTDTNDAYDSWINYFFPGTAPSSGFPSSVFNFANSGNGWGWTYTYGGGTVAKQTWVDAGAEPQSTQSTSGEIIIPATLSGSSAKGSVSLSAGSTNTLNYTSAGALIGISSSSDGVFATVLVTNDTGNFTGTSTPSSSSATFSPVSILNLSLTSNVPGATTYSMTINIPCGSNALPYKYNTTTSTWVPLTVTGSTACTITFNIPADPTIGVFTSTPTPSGTGTALGSGGSGVAAGGGGSSLPTVSVYSSGTQTGYTIANLTVGNSENLNFNNNAKTMHVTLNFITPTSAGITVSNSTASQSYTLSLNSPVAIIDPNNYTYYAELTSLSYLPILHTINLLVYGQPNQQIFVPAPANATNATTSNTPPQTPPATTVIPTTTMPAAAAVAVTPTTYNSNYLLVAIIVVIVVIVLLSIYYRNKESRKARKR